MGFVTALERRGASLEDPSVPINDGFTLLEALGGGSPTATGKRVNFDTANNFAAVYAAISVAASSVGSIPLKLYRSLPGGGKEEVRDRPLWGVLHDAPNPEMTSAAYRTAAQGHIETRGNHYAEIVTNGSGEVVEIWPLNPDKTERKISGGSVVYVVRGLDDGPLILPSDRVLHVAGLGFDGRTGWSPVKLARESIALGLAAQEYGARFYGNNSRPSGILTTDQDLDDKQGKHIKEQWELAQGGLSQAHRVAVLKGGLEWQQIGLNAEDSQFLETRKFQVREVARWFQLPPHKLADLEDAHQTNIEQQNIEFVTDSLRPRLVRWEQAMNQKLLTERDRRDGLFVEFVLEGLLRGDSEKRGQFYREQFNTASITPNEIRASENRNPLPGGDTAFVQLNMIPVDQAEAISPDQRERLLLAEHGIESPAIEAREKPTEYRSPRMRLQITTSFLPTIRSDARRLVRGERRNLTPAVEGLAQQGDILRFISFLDRYYFDDHPEFVRSVMGPVFSSYVEALAAAAADEVDSDELLVDVSALADDHTDRFATRTSAQSRLELVRLLERMEEDADPAELVEQRLEEWDDGASDTRPKAEQIADREAWQLSNWVARSSFIAAGVLGLRWVAQGGNCPFCSELNGKRVGTREPFLDKKENLQPDGADSAFRPRGRVLQPPLHGGCDCFLIPV